MKNSEIAGRLGQLQLNSRGRRRSISSSAPTYHDLLGLAPRTSTKSIQLDAPATDTTASAAQKSSAADKLFFTVKHAQRLKELARKAKINAHVLENELNSIQLFIFHPFEPLKIHWDMMVMLVMTYVLIEIPYRICFDVEMRMNHPFEIFNLLIDCLLMMDIVLTFSTGYIKDGEFITDRRKIAWNYLTGWLFIDFVTSFPLARVSGAFFGASDEAFYVSRLPRLLRFSKVARMVKLLRVFKLYRAMSQWSDMRETGFNVALRLGKFLVGVFLMAHLSACVWVGVAMLYREGAAVEEGVSPEWFKSLLWHERSWVVRTATDGYGRGQTYLFALYWAFTTLTTVGYGDITADLPLEIAWTILVMIGGTSLFGFVIGNVASVMTHEDETAVLIKNKIQSVMAYMRYRDFPAGLAGKIQRHYEYSWKRSQVYNEEEILLELPTALRTEVALYIHKDTIIKVPFLKELGDDVIPMLVLKLKPINASPRDIIIKEDYFGEEMYFCVEGELKSYLGGGKISVPVPRGHRRRRQRSKSAALGGQPSARDKLRQATFRDFRRVLSSVVGVRPGAAAGGEGGGGDGEPAPEERREMEIHVDSIRKGDYFAEYAIILDFAKHPVSVRALGFCDLFSMSKADFEDISDHFPLVFDQVIEIGQRRYLRMMTKLQGKRRWATAALVRGVALEKIEGESAEAMHDDPAGTQKDAPLGFAERYRRRRSLRQLIRERREERQASLALIKKQSKGISGQQAGRKESVNKGPGRKFSLQPQLNIVKNKRLNGKKTYVEDKTTKGHSNDPDHRDSELSLGSGSERSSSSTRRSSLRPLLGHGATAHRAMAAAATSAKARLANSFHHAGSSDVFSFDKQKSSKSLTVGSDESIQQLRDEMKTIKQLSTMSRKDGPKLSIHMLAKIKMWKNRAVMQVALNNMASKGRHHRRRTQRRARGQLGTQASTYGTSSQNLNVNPSSLQPFKEQMDNITTQQVIMDQRMEKMEAMLTDLFHHTETTNDSLVAMSKVMGKLARNEGVSMSPVQQISSEGFKDHPTVGGNPVVLSLDTTTSPAEAGPERVSDLVSPQHLQKEMSSKEGSLSRRTSGTAASFVFSPNEKKEEEAFDVPPDNIVSAGPALEEILRTKAVSGSKGMQASQRHGGIKLASQKPCPSTISRQNSGDTIANMISAVEREGGGLHLEQVDSLED